MSSISSLRRGETWEIDTAEPEIPKWPFDRDRGDVQPGLYELHPAVGKSATYAIILYAKAVHFMDVDGTRNAESEFSKIIHAFSESIPALFQDARILLLWNVSHAFTTESLLRRLSYTPAIYIVFEPDLHTRDWFLQFHRKPNRRIQYQTRGIFFLLARQPEQFDPALGITHDFDKDAIHPIDFLAFKWSSRNPSGKNSKLKIIGMPSPVVGVFRTPTRTSSFRRRNRPDLEVEDTLTGSNAGYFWLENIPRSIDKTFFDASPSLSPNKDNWMIESARVFVINLRKVVETVCSRGRSVWLMVRPLENRALLSGPSDANASFSHWGILISSLTRSQLEDRRAEANSGIDSIWGDLHELRNNYGTARYEHSTYRAKDNLRASKLDYLGQTEITDEDLFEFGHALIKSNPKYHLLKNNCQVWVEKFLSRVCPAAELEKTIAQILRTSTSSS